MKANENEQYSRKYNLWIIVALMKLKVKTVFKQICDFCEEKLDVSIDKLDIDRVHRIGPKYPDKMSRSL